MTCGLRGDAGLAAEPELELRVVGQVRRQTLDRDRPLVVGVEGAVDLTHAATTEHLVETVGPEGVRLDAHVPVRREAAEQQFSMICSDPARSRLGARYRGQSDDRQP